MSSGNNGVKPPCSIWFEFEHPRSKEHAQEICAKANKMLGKLCEMHGNEFFWIEGKGFNFGGDMGYESLPERGKWFSLDWLAR